MMQLRLLASRTFGGELLEVAREHPALLGSPDVLAHNWIERISPNLPPGQYFVLHVESLAVMPFIVEEPAPTAPKPVRPGLLKGTQCT